MTSYVNDPCHSERNGEPDADEWRPDVDTYGVPRCSENCPQHDGKRCRMLGLRPSTICEIAVLDMAAELRQLRKTVAVLR